ncbi:hypothetical protein C8N25_108163 [Algoriphagus antarcticus]|uniref:Uncharacterized protein n=1 Tax=Algoriphagus antarcticus TaxID=238540 RepID=A0A3E0DVV9_9BACT|nr:hypothetical protein C8N25_108163 [Algoriphagus antarcticus]
MKKNIFFGLILLAIVSCTKDDEDIIKTESGNIWLSGGL